MNFIERRKFKAYNDPEIIVLVIRLLILFNNRSASFRALGSFRDLQLRVHLSQDGNPK